MTATKRTLSEAQLVVLRAARDGQLSRSESIRTLYRSFLQPPTSGVAEKDVTRTVKVLTGREPALLRIGEPQRWSRPWLLTEAGEAVLVAAEGRGRS